MMLPLARARAAVGVGVRGRGSVNKLICTGLQRCCCGVREGWGDVGINKRALEDGGLLGLIGLRSAHLNRGSRTTPFATVLGVTATSGGCRTAVTAVTREQLTLGQAYY